MNGQTLPRINKLWFYVGDALLLALAVYLCFRTAGPLSVGMALVCVAAVAAGAWLAVAPWIIEYRTAEKLAESDRLASTVGQIQNLESIARQISTATSQWQTVQQSAVRTTDTAKKITDQIGAEARSFSDFLQKANSGERAALHMEVEKLRRAETDWLQVCVRMLDHVFALRQAALRSAQPNLIEQLTQFQNACHDAARRIGLVPFAAEPGAVFDAERHRLVDENANPPQGSIVADTIATGYTFQGQLVRQALVNIQTENSPASAGESIESVESAEPSAAPDPEAAGGESDFDVAALQHKKQEREQSRSAGSPSDQQDLI